MYAKWVDEALYGMASLSLIDGKFTLKLSNYGDDGSGLTGTYGFALTTKNDCSTITYTEQSYNRILEQRHTNGYYQILIQRMLEW